MNILLRDTNCKQVDFKLKVSSTSEASHFRMAYEVGMREMFNFSNDWLLQQKFPGGKGLVKNEGLISFWEDKFYL